MTQAKAESGVSIQWGAEQRDGKCPECGMGLARPDTPELRARMPLRYCPSCQEDKVGKLIVRLAKVAVPPPPECVRLRCLWHYMIDSLTYAMVVSYHRRRVAYATQNRNGKVLERYRTGEPSPRTFWGAIFANIKLTCPLCKRVELGGRRNGADTKAN